MRHALILAGGSGTRLWPYSTASLPKQLVPLFAGRSLLDLAVERALAVAGPDRVWLGTGAALREAVGGVAGLRPDRLVVEPAPRDTLAAVALGCARIAAADPQAVVAVLTADHLIEPVDRFAAELAEGFALAEDDPQLLVTFGVVPDHPATGFGYLQLGAPRSGTARVVDAFREKPDLPAAQGFLAAGPASFLWNSGMFVWRADTLLRAVERFAPEVHRAALAAADGDTAGWDGLGRLSVDYGVMEPAAGSAEFAVAAVPLTVAWRDVGSWPAYGDALGRDGAGNAVAARTVLEGSSDNLVASADPDHLVALVGCTGLVVVHTAAATLVMPAAEAQRVKDLHALVAERFPHLA